MLQRVKSHDPCQEDRKRLDEDKTVLIGRKTHGGRRTGRDDQKPDQGIDEQNFHNGISIHRFFLADLTAAF